MKYSQDAWKQLLQRVQEIPNSEWRTDEKGNVIKCRKHTDLIMHALKDTARNKGYIVFSVYLSAACK